MNAAAAARCALIVGVGGQDGALLARHLLARGVAVAGTTRQAVAPVNLLRLGIEARVALHRLDPRDRGAIDGVVGRVRPDDIYWLAAQSSVAASFERPDEGLEAAIDVMHLLAAARRHVPAARILFAASGECFGETDAAAPARETSPFAPRNPYAVGKCAAHEAVRFARAAYGQHACSAFLFTHESTLRAETFVIAKLCAAVRRIAAGSGERLRLGDCSVVRDWGWAPDYAVAMALMLAADEPDDLVIATGRSRRLEDMVADAFALVGRDWRDHVAVQATPPRPGDARSQAADPSRAAARLGWRAAVGQEAMLRRLVLGDERGA